MMEAACDINLCLGKVISPPPTKGLKWFVTSEEAYLSWKDIGTFCVRKGNEIVVDPASDVDQSSLCLFILGPVLGMLLHQRGLLVLHASVVAINDGVVAFLGDQGWGKSTIAAALHSHGHSIFADDILPLDIDGMQSRLMVHPGIPQIKLWPDSVTSLGEDPQKLPRVRPEIEKRIRLINHNCSQKPLPLERIYVLAKGMVQEIKLLSQKEAFLNLIRHSYAVYLLEATGTAATNFQQCHKIVNNVPIARLQRPFSLSALPELVKLVEEDVVKAIP